MWTSISAGCGGRDRVGGRVPEGELDLPKLAADLHGLVHAADLHDAQLLAEWREQAIQLDFEVQMASEGWPPGQDLDELLTDFQAWARRVLAATDNQRT